LEALKKIRLIFFFQKYIKFEKKKNKIFLNHYISIHVSNISQKNVRMFKPFSIHIFLIAKLGYIGLWMIATSAILKKLNKFV
jgi:hypothetical protein